MSDTTQSTLAAFGDAEPAEADGADGRPDHAGDAADEQLAETLDQIVSTLEQLTDRVTAEPASDDRAVEYPSDERLDGREFQ